MSAHTASQIVSIVSVRAADQPVAVTVALAVVSDALKSPAASSSRRQAHCYRLDAAAHRTRSPGGSCPKPEPPRDGLRPQLNQLAGYAGEYDFASQAFASWHFRWCRRERRGARRQEMYGSRPATAQTGAAKAATMAPTEPFFAGRIARPRAVAIDLAADGRGPSGRAGAQRRLRTWLNHPHKGVPPAQPTLPEGLFTAPGIEPSADPLADYLVEAASTVDIRELKFGSRALTALRDSGAVLVIPLGPFSCEPGSGQWQLTDRRASDASGEPADWRAS